ncbi:Predicted membrane protein [Nakamurella panacisegetis]|uniref:Predicted membrane protein n=1 Tax=Nakamurella panacisegetis TaxID=1090615 RepID=A0A1H0M8V9_9ACTN|nr:DUF2079 domain-containing protein [Nakamurella panacisegetis]SDO76909.1 Predicted membrane protein [Nakamurella panacisegetis]
MAGGRSDAVVAGEAAPHRRVAFISGGALVLYLLDSLIRNARFLSGYDLTIFDQGVDDYAHFRAPDVLIKSQQPFNLLGDHFHPILMLLAPLYRLWPDARMLLVAQAVLFAVSVHLLSRVAVRRLGRLGYFLGAAFALSWGVLQAVDFDFHEIAFAVPLLVLALDAVLDGRMLRMALLAGSLVLVKEDSPLLIIGIALVLLVQRRFRWAAILGVFGIGAFILLITVVIPHFSYSHTYTYFAYAGGGSHGVGGLIGTAWHTVFSLRGLIFLGALALTAGLGLRSPLILALLPTLGARIVSSNYAYTGFLFHYNATLMVICFFALIDGIVRQRGGGGRATQVLRWQTVLLAGVVAVSVARAPTIPSIAPVVAACPRCDQAQAAVSVIPDGARVAADVFLLPHLVDRAQVMQAVPGFVDSTGLPLRADWVILDLDSTSFTPGWSRTLLASLLAGGRFAEVARPGRYVVLRAVGR